MKQHSIRAESTWYPEPWIQEWTGIFPVGRSLENTELWQYMYSNFDLKAGAWFCAQDPERYYKRFARPSKRAKAASESSE